MPAFAFGLAKGDVVGVQEYEGALWVHRLHEAGGHSAVRVIGLGGRSADPVFVELAALGCEAYPTVIEGMLAFDVLPSCDTGKVERVLAARRASGEYDYSVGVWTDR